MAAMHCSRAPRRTPALALALAVWAAGAFLPLASPALAQSSDWGITFGAGFSRPTGGIFGEEWDQGGAVMLAMAGRLSSNFEFGGEFGYSKFEPSGDSLLVPGLTPGENEWEMWRLRFRGRRFFRGPDSKLAPFVMAGVGIYPITAQSTDSTGTFKVTQTGGGLSVGAGVDYRAGETVSFGLELQYHYVRTNTEILGYKASPIMDALVVIRWVPGGGGATP